jgi:4-amino-4-deoxy-L-arabinose transferase-like glycosyltransferase
MLIGSPSRLLIAAIFVGALAIRWAYAGTLFAVMGESGLTGTDSLGYLAHARLFADALKAGAVHGWDWLGPNPSTMPLFSLLLTLNILTFGQSAAFTYVLCQGALDAGTCVLVYRMAEGIDPGYARPAAIVAAINPTQIVLSGLVYTDTPFVFFVALMLYASLRWLRAPSLRVAVLIGLAIGAASLVRVFAILWLPILIGFLLLAMFFGRRVSSSRFRQLAAATVVAAVCISPVLVRNVVVYDAVALTAQGGEHLARWVAPLTREAYDGTRWSDGFTKASQAAEQRFGELSNNPFERSRQWAEVGREELLHLGAAAIAKAWTLGAALNLGTPGILLSPPVSQLPRTGFYATPGQTPLEKIRNFLFGSDNALYAWALLLGLGGLIVLRAFQLAGFVMLFARPGQASTALLFGLWALFILAINGPVGSPKYRLPLEPPFAVLAGAGLKSLNRERRPSSTYTVNG